MIFASPAFDLGKKGLKMKAMKFDFIKSILYRERQ